MSDLLFAISIITSIVWAVGYFGFNAGDKIHILLGIAIISIVFQVMRYRRSFNFSNKTIKS
jgi:low affinity Fe/Cu permease